MQLNEYCRQDAYSLAQLIKTKSLSPEEALDCALRRIEEVNPLINAIVRDCSDWARAQLKIMRGDEPFYGVPVLVKDLGFTMANVPYTAGSRFFAETIPTVNSDLINHLLALGMLPFAKTNVPELGLSYVTESLLHGACRNPYDLNRTPGGSSGGAAAAIAAGIAPVATASDGGGSIRIPAACCGLFGFKPTTGLISMGPLVAEAWSGLATAFVLARSVRDTVILFEELTAPIKKRFNWQSSDYQDELEPLTIGIPEGTFAKVPLAKPCMEAFNEVEKLLKSQGHRIVRLRLPLDLSTVSQAVLTLIAANTCAEIEAQEQKLGREVQKHELEPVTWEFMARGKRLTASQLIDAKNNLYRLMCPVHEIFSTVDLLLTPALAQLPVAIGYLSTSDEFEEYLQKNVEFSPFTSLFNQAGLPAMTIPVRRHKYLPISVQFAAAKNQDRLLLKLGLSLQKELEDFSLPIMNLRRGE